MLRCALRRQTPGDLIQDGLYAALAFALYPPPFRHVSACLIARALGARRLSASGMPSALSGSLRSASAAALLRRVTGKHLMGKATPVAEATTAPVAVQQVDLYGNLTGADPAPRIIP